MCCNKGVVSEQSVLLYCLVKQYSHTLPYRSTCFSYIHRDPQQRYERPQFHHAQSFEVIEEHFQYVFCSEKLTQCALLPEHLHCGRNRSEHHRLSWNKMVITPYYFKKRSLPIFLKHILFFNPAMYKRKLCIVDILLTNIVYIQYNSADKI